MSIYLRLPRIKKLINELTPLTGTALGLSIEQAKFCEYIAAGYTATEAYRRATHSKASQASVRVIASRWNNLPETRQRIDQLRTEASAKKEDLLNPEWVKLQVLNGLYLLGTGAENERVRLEAWKALGTARHVDTFVTNNSGTVINNNLQQATITGSADELRANLVKELQSFSALSLPEPEEVLEIDLPEQILDGD